MTSEINSRSLIDEYRGKSFYLELLRFFGTYPRARFDSLTVMYELDKTGMKTDIGKALAYLVRQKVLREYVENNTHFYSLTDDEQVLRQALETVMTEWNRWQMSFNNARSLFTAEYLGDGSSLVRFARFYLPGLFPVVIISALTIVRLPWKLYIPVLVIAVIIGSIIYTNYVNGTDSHGGKSPRNAPSSGIYASNDATVDLISGN